MKKIFILAAASLAAAFATPAMAQEADFTGLRVVGIGGLNTDGNDSAVYGGQVGYDVDMKGLVLGVTGEYSDSDDTNRNLAATARIGGSFGSNVLVYGLGGYTNLELKDTNIDLDGYRLGAGLETKIGKFLVGAEYRFSSYDLPVGRLETNGVVGTVGFRF